MRSFLKKFQTRRKLLASAALVATGLFTPLLHAQVPAYPSKGVRLIVPAAAGGATDVVGRLIATKLSAVWPHPVVVENIVGGGGIIGTQAVARAPQDGHTLLMGAINHSINASLVEKLPYNSLKDFTFIAHVVSIPNVLVVHPSVPAKNVPEFIAYAKSNPGKLVFASSGNGTSQHLSAEMFKMMTKVDFLHVPYKGSAPAVTDLLGGHVSLMFDNLPSAIQNIRAGKVRALGVTSAKRNPTLPDLPTIAESDVPGFEVMSWFGLMGPANMSLEITAKLHKEMLRIFALPDVREKLAALGADAHVTDPAKFTAYVEQEAERWAKVVKAANVKVQ